MTSTLATTKSAETALQEDELTSVINRFDALKIRIEQAQEDEKLVKFNYNTAAGNKAARSHVYNLRKLRSSIDAARKEKKSAYLEAGKRVDADARELTDSVTVLIEAHETILKKIEQDEADRKARHQGEVDSVQNERIEPENGWTLELVQMRLGVLRNLSAARLKNPKAYDFEEFTSSWLGELNIGIDFFERLLPDLHAVANVKACWTQVGKQLHGAIMPPETGWTEEILQERIKVVKLAQAFVANTPEDFQPVPPEFNQTLLELSGASVQLERVLELHAKAAIAAREQAEAEKAAAVEEAQRRWEEDQERKQTAAQLREQQEREAAETAAAEQRKKDEDARVEREVREALKKADKVALRNNPSALTEAKANTDMNRPTKSKQARAVSTLAEAMAGLNRLGIAQAIVDGTLHTSLYIDFSQFE